MCSNFLFANHGVSVMEARGRAAARAAFPSRRNDWATSIKTMTRPEGTGPGGSEKSALASGEKRADGAELAPPHIGRAGGPKVQARNRL